MAARSSWACTRVAVSHALTVTLPVDGDFEAVSPTFKVRQVLGARARCGRRALTSKRPQAHNVYRMRVHTYARDKFSVAIECQSHLTADSEITSSALTVGDKVVQFSRDCWQKGSTGWVSFDRLDSTKTTFAAFIEERHWEAPSSIKISHFEIVT